MQRRNYQILPCDQRFRVDIVFTWHELISHEAWTGLVVEAVLDAFALAFLTGALPIFVRELHPLALLVRLIVRFALTCLLLSGLRVAFGRLLSGCYPMADEAWLLNVACEKIPIKLEAGFNRTNFKFEKIINYDSKF